jgi:hypothetical protein
MDWAVSYGWAEPVGAGQVSWTVVGWGFLAWGLVAALALLLATLAASRLARRRIWCAQAGYEVDVEFEEHGVPGLRRFIAVRRCRAFSPPPWWHVDAPTSTGAPSRGLLSPWGAQDRASRGARSEAPPPQMGPRCTTPSPFPLGGAPGAGHESASCRTI